MSAKCWACIRFHCPGCDHEWANQDDFDHARSMGNSVPTGRCACPSVSRPAAERPESPPIPEAFRPELFR